MCACCVRLSTCARIVIIKIYVLVLSTPLRAWRVRDEDWFEKTFYPPMVRAAAPMFLKGEGGPHVKRFAEVVSGLADRAESPEAESRALKAPAREARF